MGSMYKSSSKISRPHDYTHLFSQSSSHSHIHNITHTHTHHPQTTTSKRNFIYKFLGILYAIRRVIKGVQYECGDKNKFKFKIG